MTRYPVDNTRPDDPNYPRFTPSDEPQPQFYVELGDYVIDREGDVLVVTSGNIQWDGDDSWAGALNRGYFRAGYIGKPDDLLGFVTWSRKATHEEVGAARQYEQSLVGGFRYDTLGQGVLL